MNNITEIFKEVYMPQKALIVYVSQSSGNAYVEAYDMDNSGRMLNAHPLSMDEAIGLAKSLNTATEKGGSFLQPQGLLPEKVLYLHTGYKSYALWYTPAQRVQLFFKDNLQIPCGGAAVPALLWKAGKTDVAIYALAGNNKPKAKTPLYHAPFFNIHNNGLVCMGTVNVSIADDCSLEDFIRAWEGYFFGSYFSHLIAEVSPVNGNIVQLWQDLVNSKRVFPNTALKQYGKKVKDLIE